MSSDPTVLPRYRAEIFGKHTGDGKLDVGFPKETANVYRCAEVDPLLARLRELEAKWQRAAETYAGSGERVHLAIRTTLATCAMELGAVIGAPRVPAQET